MARFMCMEIGTSVVRLAEIQKKGKNIEVLKTFVFDTVDDATKDGKVRVSDEIITSLREGIDASGILSTDVYFVVESTKILFKQVELPAVKNSMIQSTLELSFSEIFPVDELLYHISYVLERRYEKNGQKMMALDVFAIPNDLSESYYNISVALGLNAKGLTDTSRSIISLFPESFKGRNVAMVNINEHLSTLTISVDGDMIFNKTIPHGIYDALRQIKNSTLTNEDITMTEAAEHLYMKNILMKQLPSYISDDAREEEQLRYSVTTSIITLVKSIEATFAAFLAKEKISIQEFQLSGLGAGFAGISQLLAHEFGIPVTIVQVSDKLKVSVEAADEPLLLSCYPCIGASLDKLTFFTPEEKAGGEVARKKQIDRILMGVGLSICAVSTAISGVSWFITAGEKMDAEDTNNMLNKRIEELREMGVEVAFNNYTAAENYNKNVLDIYENTRSQNEEMTIFLEELERKLPQQARATSLKLTPASAEVSIIAEDKFVAAGVLHLLRHLETVNSMDCDGVSEDETTHEVSFVVRFNLKSALELSGAVLDENGNIIEPAPEPEEEVVEEIVTDEPADTETEQNAENMENVSDEVVNDETVNEPVEQPTDEQVEGGTE